MTLSSTENRFWAPDPHIIKWLCDRIPSDARVLEIGPGSNKDRYFPRANRFVDFVIPPDAANSPLWQQCDVTKDALPYADKSFDFVYSRHMLEDMFDPFPICAEMSRVAKAGFIETPSPIAEMCRGVDGQISDDAQAQFESAPWRGYHHHRWMVWTNDGELNFVSKYPLVEFMHGGIDADLETVLRVGSRYWNSYYLWSGEIKVRHHQSPLDFDLIRGYPRLLSQACDQSRKATDLFAIKMNLAKEAA